MTLNTPFESKLAVEEGAPELVQFGTDVRVYSSRTAIVAYEKKKVRPTYICGIDKRDIAHVLCVRAILPVRRWYCIIVGSCLTSIGRGERTKFETKTFSGILGTVPVKENSLKPPRQFSTIRGLGCVSRNLSAHEVRSGSAHRLLGGRVQLECGAPPAIGHQSASIRRK